MQGPRPRDGGGLMPAGMDGRRAAGGHAAIEQDIVQLRGLTEEMRWDAPEAAPPDAPASVSCAGSDETFPPLRADEPTDAGRLAAF